MDVSLTRSFKVGRAWRILVRGLSRRQLSGQPTDNTTTTTTTTHDEQLRSPEIDCNVSRSRRGVARTPDPLNQIIAPTPIYTTYLTGPAAAGGLLALLCRTVSSCVCKRSD